MFVIQSDTEQSFTVRVSFHFDPFTSLNNFFLNFISLNTESGKPFPSFGFFDSCTILNWP